MRLYRENRYIAKANLDWQVDRYDRLRLGGEATRFSIGATSPSWPRLGDAYLEQPGRWNLFLEDRLDLGDVVLIGGLRYDSYASRASRPSSWIRSPRAPRSANTSTSGARRSMKRVEPSTSRPLVITRPDRSHGYLSPHIQVSFPVTDRTNFRLSYAHQVQAPDFALVLDGVNVGGLGADLDFGKTISFEFGVRHAFSDDMVLDVAVYNHDNLALASARTFLVDDPVRQRKSSVVRVTNADFGNAGCGRAARPAVRQRVQRHDRLHLPERQEHRRRSAGHPGSGRGAVNELGGIVSPPPQAILPTA